MGDKYFFNLGEENIVMLAYLVVKSRICTWILGEMFMVGKNRGIDKEEDYTISQLPFF